MELLLNAINTQDRLKVHTILQNEVIDLEHEDYPFVQAIRGHQMTVLHFLLEYETRQNHSLQDRCSRRIQTIYDIKFTEDTLLGLAVKLDFGDIVQMLLKRDIDPNICDVQGMTPLHYAIRNSGIINLLLQYGANIDAQDCANMTVLHYAVINEDPHIIELLLNKGANYELQNNRKQVPKDLTSDPKIIALFEEAELPVIKEPIA